MNAKKTNIAQIRKYLNGELNARAMYKLERQAQQDPFLWDVIKGVESGGENHQANLNAIDKLIQQRVDRDRKRIIPIWKLLPVAASLLIALGIGGWWIAHRHQETVLAVNTPKVIQPDKVKVTATDTAKPTAPIGQPLIARLNRNKSQIIVKPASPQIADNLVKIKADTVGPNALNNTIAANEKQEHALKEVAILNKSAAKRTLTDANIAIVGNGYLNGKTPKAPDTLSRILMAKAEGVQVDDGFAGNRNNMVIRGMGRLTPGLEPLYVVNGIPIANFKLGSINPADIKSIHILKDTAAKAIYGSRASNGVIAINTTKSFTGLQNANVTAYGAQKKAPAFGGVANNSYLKPGTKKPDTVFTQALMGRVAGVAVDKSKVQTIDNYGDQAARNKPEQPKTVTGRVLDKNSKSPLPGVSIIVDGTKTATTTDMNGNFIITLPTGKEILDIAYIGYQRQQVKAKNRDSLNIALSENNNSLSEVVVTGYGTPKNEEAKEVEAAHPTIGWKAYNKYLADKATMPDGKTGTIKLTFTVDGSGAISDIKVVNGLAKDMNKKAIELIQHGPAWTAAGDGKLQQVNLKIKFHAN